MPINQDEIMARVCLLVAAQNLSNLEYRASTGQQQYYAKLLYLVQAQTLLIDNALDWAALELTVSDFNLFMRGWARAKYDPNGHTISDLSILDVAEMDTLPYYFVGLCSTYLLALENATDCMTGNTAILHEGGRFMSSLLGLLLLGETVLSKNYARNQYAQIIADFETLLKQSIHEEFFPNGVPKMKNKGKGDALLLTLGFTFLGHDGQSEGISDVQHLREALDDANINY